MISHLEANDEITSLESSFNALTLLSGQEENQIRVGARRKTITVFILGLLNSPSLVTLKSSAPSITCPPTPGADGRSRLQKVAPELERSCLCVISCLKWEPHVPINRWMDRQNVVYAFKGILFNHKGNKILTYAIEHEWTVKTLCWVQ